MKPMPAVLIGLSPVKRKTSYKKPPKVVPKNGATIGIYHQSTSVYLHAFSLCYPKIVVACAPDFWPVAQHI